MALSGNQQWDEIDECSLKRSERKSSFNEKTQKLIVTFSKMSVPQFLKRSVHRKNKTENSVTKRPMSLYIDHQEEDPDNLTTYMHDSTLLMALRDTELRLLESEKHNNNLESKVQSMEKEIEYLQKENQEQVAKERALTLQIQEFERRNQTKEAEVIDNEYHDHKLYSNQYQEMSLNSRIREMELSSEIAILSQRLATIDTEKQEKQIHKIMESQNRLMEQTLPYTMSAENIYDNEDGLFNNKLFEEVMKEQTQILDRDRIDKSDDDFHLKDPDDYVSTSFD